MGIHVMPISMSSMYLLCSYILRMTDSFYSAKFFNCVTDCANIIIPRLLKYKEYYNQGRDSKNI